MAQIHVIGGAGESLELPAIRRIGFSDLSDALAKGWDDFSAMPSHAIFLCLIYPLVGVFLIGLAFGYQRAAAAVPAGRGLCADRPGRCGRPLRIEPAPRGRPRQQLDPRLRRAALVVAAGDRARSGCC